MDKLKHYGQARALQERQCWRNLTADITMEPREGERKMATEKTQDQERDVGEK